MYNLLKGVLATIVLIVFPVALAGTFSQSSSFQEIPAQEVSDIIFIQKNSLIGYSGVLVSTEAQLEAQLWEMARKYELDYDRFLGLAMCESTLNPDAEGKAGEIGIFQFLPSTFSGYAESYKKVGFSIHDTNHQIELSALMISNGLQDLWTCKY